MQPKESYDLSNYVNPYTTDYVQPYEIKVSFDSSPIKVLFAELEGLFNACSEPSKNVGANKDLRIAIILPGTTQDFGKSMDAQYLYPVTNRIQTACQNLKLNLMVDAYISWECDDRTLGVEIKDEIVEQHHVADLLKYFPNTDGSKLTEKSWVEECRTKMVKRQEILYKQAKEVLSKENLIVVGGPKVNQVMANLCHIFLINYGLLGQLGMYLIPPTETLPLKLRRLAHDNKWAEWSDRTWEDRSVGWVHMIRNPWASSSNPKFLIYIGGFYAQGTPAAMLKLNQILDTFVFYTKENNTLSDDQSIKKRKIREYMLEQESDFRIGKSANDYIPAHVVEAQIDLPLNWFFGAKRPGLRAASPLWSITPPAFEGSIVNFKSIFEKQTDKDK